MSMTRLLVSTYAPRVCTMHVIIFAFDGLKQVSGCDADCNSKHEDIG